MTNTKNYLENLRIVNGRIIRFLTIFIAFSAIFIGSAAIVTAQQTAAEEPTVNDLEQFRSDLGAVTRQLNSISAEMKSVLVTQKVAGQTNSKTPQVTAELLTQAQKQLQTMSYDELAYLYKVFRDKFPEWREAPQVLKNIQKNSILNTSKGSKGSISMEAITPDDCSVAFNSQPSFFDLYTVKLTEIVAQAAYEAVPEVLNLIALGVWSPLAIGVAYAEYENSLYDRCSGDQADAALQTSITNIKGDIIERVDVNADYVIDRLTTVGNNFKTEIVNNDNSNKTMIVSNDNTNKTEITTAITNAQTSINDNSNAGKTEIINNDNTNKTTIINNDNSNATALNTNLNNSRTAIITNDNTNTTNIVNNDNANRTQIINNDNANTTTLNTAITNAKNEILADAKANKTELLRAHIEADLASESNGVKVAWYMTPTANGGKLDFVQQIVTETLANILAAGGSIGNAQSFLNKANADKASGNFKSAYDNYRKAYKAAVN